MPGKRAAKSIATKGPRRKATTFRFAPVVQKRLELLAKLKKAPLNRLVNTAVEQYVEVSLAEAEVSLKNLLHKIRASRDADPNFESAIAEFVGAEAALAAEDPVEGTPTHTAPLARKGKSRQGPTRSLIHQVLRA
jgi:predicted DNA-binding protein